MNSGPPRFSSDFERLYCDPDVFASFSSLHPISFARVLPFQSQDPVIDSPEVIHAEEAHLADRNDQTRRGVIAAYAKCGLLQPSDAANLDPVIDYFDADFFDLMGMLYANAGMFVCALRWYREFIAHLESQNPGVSSENESYYQSVYASVGYCLYSLNLFPEAISWTKSCIGPRHIADTVCRALIAHELQPTGGGIQVVERSGSRTRYIIATSDPDPARAKDATDRIQATMKAFAPFQDIYLDWVKLGTPDPEIHPGGYPFSTEYDSGALVRHKMNLIFATCAQADTLLANGFKLEARRLLSETAIIEPNADIIRERLKD